MIEHSKLRRAIGLIALFAIACDGAPPDDVDGAARDGGSARDGGPALDGGAGCHDPTEPDADGDGVADRCDVCAEGDDTRDADADGVPDECEPTGRFVNGPQHVERALFGVGELGDLDGDGDLDAFVRDIDRRLRVWIHDGSGVFEPGDWSLEPAGPDAGSFPEPPVLLDVDGDGDLDAFVGERGRCALLLNDGSARFSPAPSFSATSCAPASVIDFDRDGILDVAEVYPGRWWRGDGDGGLALVVEEIEPLAAEAVVGDVDGDGDVDVVTGGRAPGTHLSDGAGGWTRVPESGDFTTPYSLVDFDGDGDLDLLGTSTPAELGLALNDGAGRFTAPITLVSDHNGGPPAVGDVDGDGRLDLVGTHSRGSCVHFGDGRGGLSRSECEVHPPGGAFLQLVDLDRDGRLDVFGFGWPHRVRLQRADGRFLLRSESLATTRDQSSALETGDVDGDGDLDVFVHSRLNQMSRWWLNDGRGALSMGPALVPEDRPHVAGDFDGDGRLDTVSTRRERRYVHMQLADGTFSSLELPPAPTPAFLYATVGDFDGDGFDDVVWEENQVGFDIVFGSPSGLDVGGLARLDLPVTPRNYEPARVGDFDGDGDLDLLTWEHNDSFFMLLNDGAGGFSVESFPAPIQFGYSRVGDLNGDGRSDAIVFNTTGARVALGETDATRLSATGQTLTEAAVREVVLLDVEGDGDLDVALIFGDAARDVDPGPIEIWTNDGSGRFRDSGQRIESGDDGLGATGGIAGDFDGDGGEDLYVSTTLIDRLWLNR